MSQPSQLKKTLLYSALSTMIAGLSPTAFADNGDPYLTYCKGPGFEGKKIPCKRIAITNNTALTIYPVINTSANAVDEWLQAEMKVQKGEEGVKKYPHKLQYFVYVNWPEGIKTGERVVLDVPLYSELVDNPNATNFKQYITWWNGGRLAIFDRKKTLAQRHASDEKGDSTDNGLHYGPENPATPGIQCANVDNNTCKPQSLSVFSNKVGIKEATPSQLLEFTFAGSSVNGGKGNNARNMAYQDIGYNISYVDHLYLPIAMAPVGNKFIGFSGSTKSLEKFREYLRKFHNGEEKWPIFKIDGETNVVKIPGAYNLILGSKNNHLEGSDVAYTRIQKLWKSCLPNKFKELPVEISDKDKCPAQLKAGMQKVTQFFELNQHQYDSNQYPGGRSVEQNGSCDDKKYYSAMKEQGWNKAELMLGQIYGWVPYNQYCPGGTATNALCKTTNDASDPAINDAKEGKPGFETATFCTKMYYQTHKIYRDLQDSYKDNTTPKFNPYVELIHGKNYIDMDAYAYSIDDAVGYMQELGHGLIITVGGSKGLNNTMRFRPQEAIHVSMGINPELFPYLSWKSYGACPASQAGECKANMQLPKNTTGFKLGTIKPSDFPLKVVIKDFNANTKESRDYEFIINKGSNSGNGYKLPINNNIKNCKAPGTWCGGVEVIHQKDDQTGETVNYINTQMPFVKQ